MDITTTPANVIKYESDNSNTLFIAGCIIVVCFIVSVCTYNICSNISRNMVSNTDDITTDNSLDVIIDINNNDNDIEDNNIAIFPETTNTEDLPPSYNDIFFIDQRWI